MFKSFTGDSQRISGIDDPRFSGSLPRAINDIGDQVNALARHVSENMGSPAVDDSHNRTFWCRIQAKYKDDTDGYSFRLVAFGPNGKFYYMDSSDHVYNKLFDINGNKGLMAGQYVQAFRTDDGSTASRYYIIPAIPHARFEVNVTKTSGSAGSATAACSYVYTVKTIDNAYTLGTGMSPTWGRAGYGKKTIATHGVGYFEPDGDFVLAQVDEEPLSGAC